MDLLPSSHPGSLQSPSAPSEKVRGYRAFGLSVASEMVLPGLLVTAVAADPDIVVRQAAVDPAEIPVRNDSGDTVGTAPPGVLRAFVEGGRRLVVDPDPEADPDFVAAVVTGELFAALLRQRGHLVLHGSAVARDGRAVGFLGNSGWGKSTLAAALVGRGWKLLTDDLLVVAGLRGAAVPGAGPRAPLSVVAGHPSMRLAAEAADRLADDAHARHPAHTLTSKLRMDWDSAFLDHPVPLSQLFVLDPRLSDAAAVVAMPPHVAVLEVAQHTRVRRLLSSPAYQQAHMEQCAELTRTVPIAYLRRQFGLEYVPDLCDLVESTALSEPVSDQPVSGR